MKVKTISLSVLALGICSLAMATDYKSPAVGFKATAPSNKEMKMAEFSEEYKVEGAVKTDRQIASEKDASDREPSSVVTKEAKHVAVEEQMPEEKSEVKPWLFRNKLDSTH